MVKIGRNDPCPCGAKDAEGNPIKYKKCCEDIRRAAVSVLSRCQERINAKLIEVLKTRGIKRAHSSCKIDTTGYIYTYYLDNIKALTVDYTGLPMQMKTKEDMIAVSKVDVDAIPMETF